MTGEELVSPLKTRKVFRSATTSFESRYGKLNIPYTDKLEDILEYHKINIPDKVKDTINESIAGLDDSIKSTVVVLIGTQLKLMSAGGKTLYKVNATLSEFDKFKNNITV